MLGLRAAHLGETMAVTFVIGNAHKLSPSLFSPGNSIASTLANEFGEAEPGSALRISVCAGTGFVCHHPGGIVIGQMDAAARRS